MNVRDQNSLLSLKAEHRKLRKVVVERQRRDRIERCLDQLKTLLLQSDIPAIDGCAGSKLEKAELLEMTVAYVWRVQKDVERQVSLGFASCMREVDDFFARTGTGSTCGGSDAELRSHLVRRLSRCAARLRHQKETGNGSPRFQNPCTQNDENCCPSMPSTSCSATSVLASRRLQFGDPSANFLAQPEVVYGTSAALRDVNGNDALRRPLAIGSGKRIQTGNASAADSENACFRFDCRRQTPNSDHRNAAVISSTTPAIGCKQSSEPEVPPSDGCSTSTESFDQVVDYSRAVGNDVIIRDSAGVICKPEPVWRPW